MSKTNWLEEAQKRCEAAERTQRIYNDHVTPLPLEQQRFALEMLREASGLFDDIGIEHWRVDAWQDKLAKGPR